MSLPPGFITSWAHLCHQPLAIEVNVGQRTFANREPLRAYSNFKFVADDGSINEVDLLIISRYSIFLVEIKSRPGEVSGDSHTWIWRDGAREYFDDNPLLLTNRKSKKLASLLRKQLTVQKRRTPYIRSLVFLSDPAQRCKLTGPARKNVHLRMASESRLPVVWTRSCWLGTTSCATPTSKMATTEAVRLLRR